MFLLLFVFWLILSCKITFEIVVFGVFISIAVFAFSFAYLGWTWKREMNLYKLLPFIAAYIAVLEYEILKANFAVIPYIFGKKKPDGVIMHFDSGLKSQMANAVLANSITMTPGTITLNNKGASFTIHCLHSAMADGMDSSVFVKLLAKMESKIEGGKR